MRFNEIFKDFIDISQSKQIFLVNRIGSGKETNFGIPLANLYSAKLETIKKGFKYERKNNEKIETKHFAQGNLVILIEETSSILTLEEADNLYILSTDEKEAKENYLAMLQFCKTGMLEYVENEINNLIKEAKENMNSLLSVKITKEEEK